MPAIFKSNPGFTPTSITGCKVWFDAGDASYTVSGTTVTAWTNKTGNANASTGSGTVSINQASLNGKSSVRFPAGTNYLNVGSQTYTTSYRNIFFVVTVGASGSKYWYLTAGGGDVIGGHHYSWDDGDIEIDRSGTLGLRSYPTNFFSSTSVVSMCTSSGANTGIWVNGVSQTLANNNVGTGGFWSTGTSTTITLGGQSGVTTGTTDMYELLQYDGQLTSAQREQLEAYLAQKWGLVSQMPDGHLSKRAVIYPSVRKTTTTKPYYTQFSPKSIPGCILWLDGADTSTMTLISGNVSQWNDKSEKGYNATTPAGANSPPYNATTKELQFVDSNSHTLRIAQGFGDALVGTTFSIFFIARRTTGSGYHYILGNPYEPKTSRTILMIGFFNNNMQTNTYSPEFSSSISTYSSPDPVRLYCFEVQSSSLATHILNGTQIGSDTQNYTLTSFTNPELGRRYGNTYHSFNLSEMIAFSPALTAPQRQQVESYLAQKWNLSASLPANHVNTLIPAGVPATVASILAQIPRSIKAKRVYGYHRVYNPTPTVVSVRSFGGGGNYLYGIDVDRTGTYAYTVSRNGNDVNRITLATTSITRVGGGGGGGYAGPDGGNGVGGLYRATGLVIGEDGHIYIAEFASGRVRKLDLSTNVLSSVAGNPFGNEYQCNTNDGTGAGAGMCYPNDITYDSNNVLYFTESTRVRSCTRSGVVTSIAGGTTTGFVNDVGTAARFNGPYRIACDRVNNFLYIADNGNQVIRKYVIATGVVTTFATSTGTNSLLHCDEEGTLFVGNQSGGIRAYQSDGTYTTILNSAGYTSVGAHMDMVLSYDKKFIYIVRNDNVTVYELTLSTVVA